MNDDGGMFDFAAKPIPIVRFVDGHWQEIEPPRPMKVNRTEVDKRRRHRKEVRRQKRRQK